MPSPPSPDGGLYYSGITRLGYLLRQPDGGAAALRILRDVGDDGKAVFLKQRGILLRREAGVIKRFAGEIAYGHAIEMAGCEHQRGTGSRECGEARKHGPLVILI